MYVFPCKVTFIFIMKIQILEMNKRVNGTEKKNMMFKMVLPVNLNLIKETVLYKLLVQEIMEQGLIEQGILLSRSFYSHWLNIFRLCFMSRRGVWKSRKPESGIGTGIGT